MKKTTVALIIAAFLTALGLTPSVSAPVGDWAANFVVPAASALGLNSSSNERAVGEVSISPSGLRSLDECLSRCTGRDRLCCEAQPTFKLAASSAAISP